MNNQKNKKKKLFFRIFEQDCKFSTQKGNLIMKKTRYLCTSKNNNNK